jgi:hypothetical protein
MSTRIALPLAPSSSARPCAVKVISGVRTIMVTVSPRLTMHRVRRRSFAVSGLDEGVLLFELSETFPVRIR